MPDESSEPTQTTPKGADRKRLLNLDDNAGGTEIPVPEREDVMAALRKVAKADDEKPATD